MALDCPYCGCHTCCNPNTGGPCADCGRLVTRAIIDSQWLADMCACASSSTARAVARVAPVGPAAPLGAVDPLPF
jgi:hypothetical protein